MAHLSSSYDSYETFLTAEDAPWSLDGIWSADLSALNSSGVSGSVVLGLSTEADGSQRLNVSLVAEGLAPNQVHLQHIHGLFDDDGNPVDSVAPTIENDTDRDGIVEVLEGVGSYGDIILSLINAAGNAPTSDANGQVSYINNFDLSVASNFVSPVSGNQYTAEDLMPLFNREVVVHGVTLPDNIGLGTDGEANGEGGYIPILPAAAGEIEVTTQADAVSILADQREISSDALFGTVGNDIIGAGIGDDTVRGFDGDDLVFGGSDNDLITGNGGNDKIFGGTGMDTVSGNAGEDSVGGGAGDDEVYGGGGADVMFGGAGNDILGGAGGNDTIFAGAGADDLFGGSGDDIIFGFQGNDNIRGGAGADLFAHNGSANQGSDVILDFNSDDGDMLRFTRNGTFSADDFTVTSTSDGGLGNGGTEDLIVFFNATAQEAWTIVDGENLDSLMVMTDDGTFDLLA